MGGEILAPEPSDSPVQFIDARDLMEWVMTLIEEGASGIFNATGPREKLTMVDLLRTCMHHASQPSDLRWVPAEFLLNEGVEPWSDLPLWLPDPAYAGMNAFNCEKAFRAGLYIRPLAETINATLTWHRSRADQTEVSAGLSPEREAQLLQKWQERSE
jgi:2'-hydroxyisoflavone reductase